MNQERVHQRRLWKGVVLKSAIMTTTILGQSTAFAQQQLPRDPAGDVRTFKGFSGKGEYGPKQKEFMQGIPGTNQSDGVTLTPYRPNDQGLPDEPRPTQALPGEPKWGDKFTWPGAYAKVDPCKEFKGKKEDVQAAGVLLATLLARSNKSVDKFKENTPTGCLGVQWKYYLGVLEAFGKGAL
jgi:hypothetical protein